MLNGGMVDWGIGIRVMGIWYWGNEVDKVE